MVETHHQPVAHVSAAALVEVVPVDALESTAPRRQAAVEGADGFQGLAVEGAGLVLSNARGPPCHVVAVQEGAAIEEV